MDVNQAEVLLAQAAASLAYWLDAPRTWIVYAESAVASRQDA